MKSTAAAAISIIYNCRGLWKCRHGTSPKNAAAQAEQPQRKHKQRPSMSHRMRHAGRTCAHRPPIPFISSLGQDPMTCADISSTMQKSMQALLPVRRKSWKLNRQAGGGRQVRNDRCAAWRQLVSMPRTNQRARTPLPGGGDTNSGAGRGRWRKAPPFVEKGVRWMPPSPTGRTHRAA